MLFVFTPASKQASLFFAFECSTHIFSTKINSINQGHLEDIFHFCFTHLKFKSFAILPPSLTAQVNWFVFTKNTTKMLELPCKQQKTLNILLACALMSAHTLIWATTQRRSWKTLLPGGFLSVQVLQRDAGVWEQAGTTAEDFTRNAQEEVKHRTADASSMDSILNWI